MISVVIPIRTESESNRRDGHWARHRRSREQKGAVAIVLGQKPRPALPCVVEMVRRGPRFLDDDNLAGALKAVQDAVAQWLRTGDSMRDPVLWIREQEKGDYEVSITIRSATEEESRRIEERVAKAGGPRKVRKAQ